jgi:hypothetical protein
MHEHDWKDHLWEFAAALLGARRVSARRGWAGEKAGLFEHPAYGGPTFHLSGLTFHGSLERGRAWQTP